LDARAASLNKSGFKVTPHSAPWSPDYLGRVDEGKAGHLNLIGGAGDFAAPGKFVGVFFQSYSPQFGFRNPELFNLLDKGEAEPHEAKREDIYKNAHRLVLAFL